MPKTEGAFIDLKERIAICGAFSPAERAFILDAVNDAMRSVVAVELHAPPNYMGRIDRLWAFLSLDDGGEGVVAAPFGGGLTAPLIAADKARLDSLIPMARQLAKVFGKPIRLAKFDQRTDVEIYQP
jgi:hypothetical protein